MKQIICPKKGVKLSQEKDCECKEFHVFKDKNNEPIIECVKCKTRYQLQTLIHNSFKVSRKKVLENGEYEVSIIRLYKAENN